MAAAWPGGIWMVVPDAVVVTAVLVPGFACFQLMKYIAVYERKLGDLEMTVWSLLLSLFIYMLTAVANGIANLDSLQQRVYEPLVIASFVGFTVLVAVTCGVVYRYVVNRSVPVVWGEAWEHFFVNAAKEKRYLIVFTEDELEFMGWIQMAGKDDNPKELIINDPERIIRDKDARYQDSIPYGKRMLFSAADVKRVAMLEFGSDQEQDV